MTDFQFHMFALPLVYAPIVFGIYASVAYYRKLSIDKINSWKRASIITNISPNEFIQISQIFVPIRDANLLISPYYQKNSSRL
jgi:hypothetical protein